MAKSYFYDENISDWRELVKGEQGEPGEKGESGAISSVQPFLSHIVDNQRDLSVVALGDSTGDGKNRWVYYFWQKLADKYPTHTFTYRAWNSTLGQYSEPEIVSVGTGEHTVEMSNSNVSGRSSSSWQGDQIHSALYEVPTDLILISLGHNQFPTTTENLDTWRSQYLSLTETINQKMPSVPIVIIAQNPQESNDFQAGRAEAYRQIAQRQGYGFIDVHSAFIRDGRNLTYDGIHPGVEGSQLWADVVLDAFTPGKADQRIQLPSLLDNKGAENLISNGLFTSWEGQLPKGMSFSAGSVEALRDTVDFETGDSSVHLTSGASNPAALWVLDHKQVRGKTLTWAVRAKISRNGGNQTGRIGFLDSNGLAAPSISSPDNSDWRWLVHTGTFAEDTTTATLYFYLGPEGSQAKIDRMILVEGVWPSDAVALGESGVGWQTPEGLTLAEDVSADSVKIRRDGNRVHLTINNLVPPTGDTRLQIINIPVGYRATTTATTPGTLGFYPTYGHLRGQSIDQRIHSVTIYGDRISWVSGWNAVDNVPLGRIGRLDGIISWWTEDDPV